MAFVFAKLDPAIHRNPKVRKAGRLGREVFIFALCVNADRGATGIIPADYLEPWFLADALQITEAEASHRFCDMASYTGVPAYIVHLTCEGALNAVRDAARRGVVGRERTEQEGPSPLHRHGGRHQGADADAGRAGAP